LSIGSAKTLIKYQSKVCVKIEMDWEISMKHNKIDFCCSECFERQLSGERNYKYQTFCIGLFGRS
jgi:hypothetical protein